MTNVIRVRATDPGDILAPAVELAVYSPDGTLIEAFQFDDWLSWGDALLSTERIALAPPEAAPAKDWCLKCGAPKPEGEQGQGWTYKDRTMCPSCWSAYIG